LAFGKNRKFKIASEAFPVKGFSDFRLFNFLIAKIIFQKIIWKIKKAVAIFALEVLTKSIATYPERWREMAR